MNDHEIHNEAFRLLDSMDPAEALRRLKGSGVSPCSALAADVARCNGIKSNESEEGWRQGCETCLRRTAPRPNRCWMIKPPPIMVFECEFLIKPDAESCDPTHKGS